MDTCYDRPAAAATALSHPVVRDMKPLAGNNGLPATGAEGILAALSGNVARIDILQPGSNSDVSGLNEGSTGVEPRSVSW